MRFKLIQLLAVLPGLAKERLTHTKKTVCHAACCGAPTLSDLSAFTDATEVNSADAGRDERSLVLIAAERAATERLLTVNVTQAPREKVHVLNGMEHIWTTSCCFLVSLT